MAADRFVHERDIRRVVQRCHNALWERHGLDPAQAFDELSKLLFVKLLDESRPLGTTTGADPTDYLAATVRRTFDQAKSAPGFDNIWLDDDRIVADDLAIAEVFRNLAPGRAQV